MTGNRLVMSLRAGIRARTAGALAAGPVALALPVLVEAASEGGESSLIEVNDALHGNADGALEAHHDGRVIDVDGAEIGKERAERRRERLARQGAARPC